MIYNLGNFVKPPNKGDRVIFIYDPNNTVTMTVDPYSSTFFHKGKYVYILTDGRMNINQSLEFINVNESMDAVAKLNDVKKMFIDGLADDCGMDPNYFTSGQSDARYVFVAGDTMTGDLSISPLSFAGGDMYERNTNVDSNGKIIIGNQFRVQKLGITTSQYCDHFSHTEAYSCIWFYSVKDGTNLRTGQIAAVWTDDGTDISYSHTTTNDIGNTTDIDFVVNTDGGHTNIRLFAEIVGGTWNIRMLRLFI